MTEVCPVPPDQRPLHEFRQLQTSWFFRWPLQSPASLTRSLLLGWMLCLPLTLLVASGSLPLRHHPPQLVIAGALAALALPALLLVRQWLGWTYVQRRLTSERIAYEESGWYDGQEWEKPLHWRQQDLLVAQHQVKPVLQRLLRAALWLLLLVAGGTGLWQAL
ncbi:MAG: CGLD27 family protein [Cyanobacteriota bacterium]